jgi:IPT/TIG domain/Putative Ig domain
MNRPLRYLSLWVALGSVSLLVGCGGGGGGGGGSGSSTPPVLSISGATAMAIDQGQSLNITVNVQNGGGQGVTWKCSGAACTSTSLTNTSSLTVTFTANGPTGKATVTATAAKDTSVTASATITVSALPAITTTQPQLTAVPATVGQHYSLSFAASGGSGSLTWTATGLPANGLSLSSTGVLSGTPTTAGKTTFTVTVTDSSAAGARTATSPSLNLTVNAGGGPRITSLTPDSGALGTSVTIAGTNFGATQGTSTVTFNGTKATPTSWSDTSIVAPAPTGATTGSVIVTAGGVASNGVTFTVTIASSCGSGSESLLSGHYALLVSGFDNSQPIGIGAVFDADGAGHVASTVGVEDINSAGDLGRYLGLSIDSAKSSYSVGSDQRGCLVIVSAAGTGTPSPASSPITLTFRFALTSLTLGVAHSGRVVEFDSTGPSGVNTVGGLLRQDTSAFSTAAINGSYAFGAEGREVGSGQFGIAGAFTTNGAGGLTSAEADYNTENGGNLDGMSGATDFPSDPVTLNAGASYSVDTQSGRGEMGFDLSDGSVVAASIYVISAKELLLLRSNPQDSTSPLFVGRALQQSKASFGSGDLNGTSVYYASGIGSTGTRTDLAIINANGSGTFSITLNQNDSGVLTSGSSSSGTYTMGKNTVGSTGRVLVSGIGKHNSVLYLVATNKGFTLDSGAHCDSGFLAPQSGAPFTNASVSSPAYAFGTIRPGDPHVDDVSGILNFDGNENISGTADENSTGGGGTLNPDQAINSTYAVDATGTGLIPSGCSLTAGNCDYIFLVISPSSATFPFGEIVLMDANSGNTYPTEKAADQ